MRTSIDLIGITLDIENDCISNNTKKICHLYLTQFMLFLCDKQQEMLSFVGPLIIVNKKDSRNKNRSFCM